MRFSPARPAIAVSLLLLAGCPGEKPVARPTDLRGRPVDPLDVPGARGFCFIFIGLDCPVSNRYAPEMTRLHELCSRGGIAFHLVHADPGVDAARAAAHRKEYHLPDAILLDPHQSLVGPCRATVTPDAALFDADRRLVYHGRIDDRVTDFTRSRPEATRHDLRDAIEALLAGKPVAPPGGKTVGCPIPEATP